LLKKAQREHSLLTIQTHFQRMGDSIVIVALLYYARASISFRTHHAAALALLITAH
jgi:hypothetical protein